MFDELVVVFIQPILSTIGESLAFEADYHIQNSIRSDEAQSTKTCSCPFYASFASSMPLNFAVSLFLYSLVPAAGFFESSKKKPSPTNYCIMHFWRRSCFSHWNFKNWRSASSEL